MSNMSLPLILVGSPDAAMAEMGKIRKTGHTPVSLVTEFYKSETKIPEPSLQELAISVTNLKEAVGTHVIYRLYVVPDEDLRKDIFEVLEKCNIPESWILNYNFEKELSAGCDLLNHQFLYDSSYIFPCCKYNETMNKPPMVKYDFDESCVSIEDMIGIYKDLRTRLVESIKNNADSECKGCSMIKYDFFPVEKKVKSLAYGIDAPCQLACIYCGHRNAVNKLNESEKKFISNFDWVGLVKGLEHHNLLSDDALITFTGGELTINPQKKEMLDIVEKYRISVSTNAVIFDKHIGELTAREGSYQSVSVDAGTEETYKKVKGVNAYNVVWENIENYVKLGSDVRLKYIFIPENSNDTDVEGFVSKAKEVGVSSVSISTDVRRNRPLTNEEVNAILKMLELARQKNIFTFFVDGTFNSDDIYHLNLAFVKKNRDIRLFSFFSQQDELTKAKNQIFALHKKIDEEIETIYNSTSWRVTKPLRAVKKIFLCMKKG